MDEQEENIKRKKFIKKINKFVKTNGEAVVYLNNLNSYKTIIFCTCAVKYTKNNTDIALFHGDYVIAIIDCNDIYNIR